MLPQRASNLLKLQNTDKKESFKKMDSLEMDLLQNDLIQKMKKEEPNLFQILEDYIDDKISSQELEVFLNMDRKDRRVYIDNYQAR